MSEGTSDTVRQFTVQHDDDGVRLDRWFKRHLPQVGFATVSRWARTGQIRVDGKRADPADRLSAGQVLRVPPGGTQPAASGERARPPRRPHRRTLSNVCRTNTSSCAAWSSNLPRPPGPAAAPARAAAMPSSTARAVLRRRETA